METRLYLIAAFFFFVIPAIVHSVAAAEPVPSRVGRVSVVIGNVSLRPAGGDWTNALVNMPVAAGMAVRTEKGDARAELRIGHQRLALAAGTPISLAPIDDRVTQIAARRGRIGFEARRLDTDETVQIPGPRGGT